MANKKFDNGTSAIVELTKISQASLQKLPPEARILGFGVLALSVCAVVFLVCRVVAVEAKQALLAVCVLLVFAVTVIFFYVLHRTLNHWMSLWEKIQLSKLQNEVTHTLRGKGPDE